MDWSGQETRRRFERGRREVAQWRRPKRLTLGVVEALSFLRSVDLVGEKSKFLVDLHDRAQDTAWTPTPRLEKALLKIKAERSQQERK